VSGIACAAKARAKPNKAIAYCSDHCLFPPDHRNKMLLPRRADRNFDQDQTHWNFVCYHTYFKSEFE
jgi:hypothetical protein